MNLSRTTLSLFLTALALVFPSSVQADSNWKNLVPINPTLFSVSMPGNPEKQGERTEWRSEDDEQRVYSVGYGLYTEPQIKDANAFMQKISLVLAHNTGSKVAYLWFFKQQGAPACEFKLVNTENQLVTVMRYFLVNQWFYFVSYTTSIKSFDMDRMKKFHASFQMINPALKSSSR